MSYRLGVDVGGTFTDVLLVRGGHRRDLAGQDRVHAGRPGRRRAHRDRQGVRRRPASSRRERSPRCCTAPRWPPTRSWRARAPGVGLVTTVGFRQVLQIARSYVPGGLAGWIIWPKPEPLAALEDTVEVDERLASDGTRASGSWTRTSVRAQLARLTGVDALAVSLINSFADPRHERRIAELAAEVLPGVPVSLSCGRAARAARVRAHRDHGRERLRAAAGQALRRGALGGRLRDGGGARRAGHPAQRRRAVRGRGRGGRPGDHAAVRAGRRGDRRGVGGRAVRLLRPDHLRHGRHLHRHRAGAGPDPADRPRDQGRRPDRAGVQRGRANGGRGRRFDRARSRADQGAAGRAAVRGRRSRARPPTARAAPSRP